MLGCSICPSRCLLASKWKHLPCTANPCPLPGVEAGLDLLAWPETQGLVYCLAPAAVIKHRAASQMPPDTLSHINCISYYPFLFFLASLFATPASPFLFLNQERQPAPNYFFLISPSSAISIPEFVISDIASQVISALCAITGMVTRHTGLARSYFPECPHATLQLSVWFGCCSHTSPLTTRGIQPGLTAPSVAFASFSQYSLSHPAFHMSHPLSHPLTSPPFPGSSTSGQGPADSLVPAVLTPSPSSRLQHYYLLVNDLYEDY